MRISLTRIVIFLSLMAIGGCADSYSPPGSNGNLDITVNSTVSNTTVIR